MQALYVPQVVCHVTIFVNIGKICENPNMQPYMGSVKNAQWGLFDFYMTM